MLGDIGLGQGVCGRGFGSGGLVVGSLLGAEGESAGGEGDHECHTDGTDQAPQPAQAPLLGFMFGVCGGTRGIDESGFDGGELAGVVGDPVDCAGESGTSVELGVVAV